MAPVSVVKWNLADDLQEKFAGFIPVKMEWLHTLKPVGQHLLVLSRPVFDGKISLADLFRLRQPILRRRNNKRITFRVHDAPGDIP